MARELNWDFEIAITKTKAAILLAAALVSYSPKPLGSESVTLNSYYPVAYGGYARAYAENLSAGPSSSMLAFGTDTNQLPSVNAISSIAGLRLDTEGGEMILYADKITLGEKRTHYNNFCQWEVNDNGSCPSGRSSTARGTYNSTYDEIRIQYSSSTTERWDRTLCCRFSATEEAE